MMASPDTDHAPKPLLTATGLASQKAGPFDLALNTGECVCVMGASGAGKSLFLRLLADLDPNEGPVTLAGADRRSMSAPQWRRRVVYQAAEPAWWLDTVRAHIAPADIDDALATMQRLQLAPALLDQPIAQLSTGQRQRLALVRSTAHRPDVLLLDEPTASLDAGSVLLVEAALRQAMATGVGIVLVTHSAEQAARLGRRTLTIADGRFQP